MNKQKHRHKSQFVDYSGVSVKTRYSVTVVAVAQDMYMSSVCYEKYTGSQCCECQSAVVVVEGSLVLSRPEGHYTVNH